MSNLITRKLSEKDLFENLKPATKLQLYWYNIKDTVRLWIPWSVRDFFRKHIETIWRPQHSRIRKAIPKYWMDLDYVLLEVNFEIIKSFYEDEYFQGIVDWEGTGGEAKEFTTWLEDAYKYITVDRPALEKQIDKAYPNYKKVDKLEQQMEKEDTTILVQLALWRKHMWT